MLNIRLGSQLFRKISLVAFLDKGLVLCVRIKLKMLGFGWKANDRNLKLFMSIT